MKAFDIMNFIKILKIYFGFVLKYKLIYFSFIFCVITTAIIWNIIPLLYKSFISLAQNGDYKSLYVPLLEIALVLVLNLILDTRLERFQYILRLKIEADAKTKALINLQNQDYNYHTEKSSGKLIKTIDRFDKGFDGLLTTLNNDILNAVLSFLIAIIIISSISFIIGVSILIILIVSFPVIYYCVKQTFITQKQAFSPEEDISAIIVDNLTNFETVKSFARENFEQKRIEIAYKVSFKPNLVNGTWFGRMDIATGITGIFILLVTILLSIVEFQNQALTIASFVVIIGFLFQFPAKLQKLVDSLRKIIKSSAEFRAFAELLDLKPTIIDIDNPVSINKPLGRIKFENVDFNYNNQININDLNLEIEPGQEIAFVGPSGAGKSTITKLLLRYYDVTNGKISIDGVNIKNISQHELRQIIGIVPQDPIMFNNTIAFNVGYALDNPSIKLIEDACKLAQIHDFILTLPKKYETIVGERGIKVSGGQRQRLAIARMILKNPKVIIFDEATSALDSESELLIQKAFTELSKNKTSIVIAHRLSTIIHSDKIFVLDKGHISQIGTHNELVNQEGIYQKLWNIQAGGFVNE